MFKRKLRALNFPQVNEFDHQNEEQFRNVVLWLEDQKIRHYKIEDREGLRKRDSPEEWNKACKKYLTDMGCPYEMSDVKAVLDWILGMAVRYDYGDNVDKYKNKTAEKIVATRAPSTPQLVSENPLDKLNFDDPEFKNGVHTLAKMLNIPSHPDHLVMLKAISKLIQARLSSDDVSPSSLEEKAEVKPISLDSLQLGFETGDYVLNNAAKALRLLHVVELRDLQTKINETIVLIQNLTADPRTDERLGKVGFMG